MGEDTIRGAAQEVQNQIQEFSERKNTENEKEEMTNKIIHENFPEKKRISRLKELSGFPEQKIKRHTKGLLL